MVLSLQVILSTCYTSGLELTDLYPYGTEHGDTMRIQDRLPTVSLLAPINNLVRFGPIGVTATKYQVSIAKHSHIHVHACTQTHTHAHTHY